MYSRSLSRQIGFACRNHGILALAADKGGGSGGGETLTIPQLTQKLKDLETEKATLQGQIETAKNETKETEAKLKTAQTEKEGLQTKLDAAEKAKVDLQAKLDAAESAKVDVQTKLTAAEQKVKDGETTLESAKTEAKTNLQAAQTKANEAAARAGMKLPFDLSASVKAEGEKQNGNDADKNKTPRERLAAFCKVAGEE